MNKPKNIDTLPLHLGLAMANWISSHSVWQIANSASQSLSAPSAAPNPPPPSKKAQPASLKPKAQKASKPAKLNPLAADQVLKSLQALQSDLQVEPQKQKIKKSLLNEQLNENFNVLDEDNIAAAFPAYLELLAQPDFLQAIQNEAQNRTILMLQGISDYQESSYERTAIASKVIWQKGSACLLDYGNDPDATAILCIPSLINKPYILDLYEEHSFIDYCIQQGYRPLILDWGEPGLRERHYDCADYVEKLALDALDYLGRHHEGPVYLLGYCMGGVFALAMAQLMPEAIDGLILLATPWDFAAQRELVPLDDEVLSEYESLIKQQDTVPPGWVQSIFHMVNPWHFQEKYQRFPTMNEVERQHFLAVESWVNDGVPLARHVARECLIDWPQRNHLAAGKWRVRGEVIDPSMIECPTFIATPTSDRVVPLSCSQPLLDLIPHAASIAPKTGHVSMVAGHKARSACWQPIHQWIKAQN